MYTFVLDTEALENTSCDETKKSEVRKWKLDTLKEIISSLNLYVGNVKTSTDPGPLNLGMFVYQNYSLIYVTVGYVAKLNCNHRNFNIFL